MRFFLHSIRINRRCAAQYRASFLMHTAAQLVMTAGDLWAVLILLERFGGMRQWEGPEILVFFGAMQIVFAFTEIVNRGLGTFSGAIR